MKSVGSITAPTINIEICRQNFENCALFPYLHEELNDRRNRQFS